MMRLAFLLAPLLSLTPLAPSAPATAVAPAVAGTLVQSGTVFTGVFQGSRTLDLPLTLAAFSPGQGKLVRVEVDLDARLSGEYTIQPTTVPPNGTVESHATTSFRLDGKTLASTKIDFAPIPWIYPVSFPLNVLWALDASGAAALGDKQTLRAFTGNKPLEATMHVAVTAKVAPAGWADPHLQGVLASYEVRYVYE